jgi:hypothetical protein
MTIVLTIFPSLISTRDDSVIQKAQAANVIEANNTVSSSSMVNSMVTKIVKVNDIEVAYKIFGKGELLVLIPGFSMTMDMWDPIALHKLSSNHTIIIFDNRRIGSTTAGIKTPSIQQFANDTAGLVDALGMYAKDTPAASTFTRTH